MFIVLSANDGTRMDSSVLSAPYIFWSIRGFRPRANPWASSKWQRDHCVSYQVTYIHNFLPLHSIIAKGQGADPIAPFEEKPVLRTLGPVWLFVYIFVYLLLVEARRAATGSTTARSCSLPFRMPPMPAARRGGSIPCLTCHIHLRTGPLESIGFGEKGLLLERVVDSFSSHAPSMVQIATTSRLLW